MCYEAFSKLCKIERRKKHLKNLKNKTRIESIIVTILLITSIALIMLPAEAQRTYINMQEGGSIPGAIPSGATADVVEETRAFLSFSPNGARQTVHALPPSLCRVSTPLAQPAIIPFRPAFALPWLRVQLFWLCRWCLGVWPI